MPVIFKSQIMINVFIDSPLSFKKKKKLKNAIFKLWRKKKFIDITQNSFDESIIFKAFLDNAQLLRNIYQYHLMQPQ